MARQIRDALDISSIDAAVAVRLRVTGYSRAEIEQALASARAGEEARGTATCGVPPISRLGRLETVRRYASIATGKDGLSSKVDPANDCRGQQVRPKNDRQGKAIGWVWCRCLMPIPSATNDATVTPRGVIGGLRRDDSCYYPLPTVRGLGQDGHDDEL
jgi:hypothetical protein